MVFRSWYPDKPKSEQMRSIPGEEDIRGQIRDKVHGSQSQKRYTDHFSRGREDGWKQGRRDLAVAGIETKTRQAYKNCYLRKKKLLRILDEFDRSNLPIYRF